MQHFKRKTQQNYEVLDPNPYSQYDSGDSKKIVCVKVLDVIFEDEVCSLIYMQDLTQFHKEKDKDKVRDNLSFANACVSEEIQAPQETIIMLTQQLIEECTES